VSKKKLIKIHKPILFTELTYLQISTIINPVQKKVNVSTLEISKSFKLGESGRFFKKITFFVLGLNHLYQKTYRLLKIRSLINAL
jgi:hypothetical protein